MSHSCYNYSLPQHCFVLQVFCAEDELHDIIFGGDFRKGMVHFAQRKVIIRERFFKNEAEIFLEGAVIDIDRPGRITQPALLFGMFQVEEKRTQLPDVCIIKGDIISILQPAAAFEDRLEIAFDRTRAVIDQLQDIRDALQFRFEELRLCVLHVHSFQNKFTVTNAKLFCWRSTSTLEVNEKIKYTHLALSGL